MPRLIANRLWQSLIVLLCVSFVSYALIGAMPGDPVDVMISSDPRLSAEDAARMRAIYGLDQPLEDRYIAWLQAALAGDLGYSRLQARPVADALAPAVAATAMLMGAALIIALAIGLPLGIAAALRRHSWIDHAVSLVAFVGISAPPFWTALLLIIIFAVLLGALPAGGSAAMTGGDLFSDLRYMVLPVASLVLGTVGGYVRYVRAAMLDVLDREWIRTARAKGVPERRVVVYHALRAALIPIATVVGIDLGALFSGALVTETVFARPGMGKLIYDAVLGNDFNLALSALLLATALTLVGNLLADIACGALDPRISWKARSG